MENPSQKQNISIPIIVKSQSGSTGEFATKYSSPGPLTPSNDFRNQGIGHSLLKG